MYRDRVINIFFWILRAGTGAFFLTVGAMKAMHLDRLEADIDRFDIVPHDWAWPMACLGIAVELVVGGCLFFKRMYAGATALGVALTASFVTLFVQGWVRGLSLSCSCLGVQREVDNYPFEVTWRVLLLGVMLLLFWDANYRDKVYFKPVRLDFSDI